MKIPKPAAADAVGEAAHQVTLRTDELDAVRAEIAAAEAALPALALDPDDAKYEEASLSIDRLKRRDLRAEKRLIVAEAAHAMAIEHEEQDRRKSLHEAGQRAAAEAEKLAGTYAEHTAAIAETLRKIEKLRGSIDVANDALPDGERTIDVHALGIHSHVELPAATKDGERFWWRPDYYGRGPLHPQPKHSPGHILLDGVCVPFDEGNPAHIAARDARPSMGQMIASKSPSQPVSEFGERTLPDGTRKIKLPPNEWPPKPASAQH